MQPLELKSKSLRIHQLNTGLGAGNTGDDAIFLAAQTQLPAQFKLSTEIHSLERAAVLPRGVRYLRVAETKAIEESIRAADLILLIGSTAVMDQWGLDWPLHATAGKLRLCHHLGKPVHALGVGADRLSHPKGLRIFKECYAPIESWSVRTTQCKESLQEMGIPEERIAIGADWAWLLPPVLKIGWAREWLARYHVEGNKVNIGINVVNEIWKNKWKMKRTWAALLDRIVEKYNAQIFFFCNESRSGEYFDAAAAEDIRSRMRNPAFVVANRYYQAAEMISLISLMHITISQRYHFTLFSVLADVYPISIERGQKMHGLNEDLGLPCLGNMECIAEASIEAEVKDVLENTESRLKPLRLRRRQLENRAHNNLSLLMQSLLDRKMLE
jgi:polysaccharide pyruvyl transferase WcaK-like protein